MLQALEFIPKFLSGFSNFFETKTFWGTVQMAIFQLLVQVKFWLFEIRGRQQKRVSP